VLSGRKDNNQHDLDCERRKSQNQKTVTGDSRVCNKSFLKSGDLEADDSGSTKRKCNNKTGHTDDFFSSDQHDSIEHPTKKTRLKPTEQIYYHPNPPKRRPILVNDRDHQLIASIHSTRPDLTSGSGLGFAGFEIGSFQGKTAGASGDGIATVCNRSKNVSMYQERDTLQRGSSVGSCADYVAGIERKRPGSAPCYAEDVIVLDESDDEIQLVKKPRAVFTASSNSSRNDSSELEVIEID
jgi:hypothetical protein